jgi:hypothetical protein
MSKKTIGLAVAWLFFAALIIVFGPRSARGEELAPGMVVGINAVCMDAADAERAGKLIATDVQAAKAYFEDPSNSCGFMSATVQGILGRKLFTFYGAEGTVLVYEVTSATGEHGFAFVTPPPGKGA